MRQNTHRAMRDLDILDLDPEASPDEWAPLPRSPGGYRRRPQVERDRNDDEIPDDAA